MSLVTFRRHRAKGFFIRMCAVQSAALVRFLTSLVSACCVDLQVSGCAGGGAVWSRLGSVRWSMLANAL